MKTLVNLRKHLAEFVLKWETFQTKVEEKIETHNSRSEVFFSEKSCHLWSYEERYGTPGKATENTTRRMRNAC